MTASSRFAPTGELAGDAAVARDEVLGRLVRIERCDGARKARLRELARGDSPFLQAVLDIDGDQAVLWVEGVDRDDIRQRGRVLMRRDGDQWVFAEADLDSVEK